ncbi:alpha/beta hydrolase fold domain-containing protein [Oceanivirga salmonicida]|uniref:alpha/beta hydrolase fold domain-containing protein n=1 Tax=Oceanivirga salmonicida TaxID=1769291 RepID=UPI0012E27958|nr:alpha/beta hydrolase [Oceanivirga salmonicida]
MKLFFKIILLIVLIIFLAVFYVNLIQKRSFRSFVVEKYLWLNNEKSYFEEKSDELFEKQIEESMKKSDMAYEKPVNYIDYEINEKYIEGMQTFIWNDKKDINQKNIIYIHGGSYINQPNSYHFKALNNITKKTDAKVFFPIYPKAPKHTYIDSLLKLETLYKNILNENIKPENITIMGDSSGGGLALSFALFIRDKNLIQPKNIILVSPWLDLTLTNEKIKEYESKDPILSSWALKKIGILWAGSKEETKNKYVSPIFNSFENLGKITIITGTNDILYPDILKLKKILEDSKIDFNIIIKEKMGHVYIIYPIPEAKETQDEVIKIIKKI